MYSCVKINILNLDLNAQAAQRNGSALQDFLFHKINGRQKKGLKKTGVCL